MAFSFLSARHFFYPISSLARQFSEKKSIFEIFLCRVLIK